MSLGNRLKDLRKKKGLNQTEMGEVLGVTLNTVFNIESGKSDMPSEMLKKASEFFEVSTDYLITGKESTGEISEEEREVLTAMREDTAFKKVAIEAAKAKKKVINYFRNYKNENHAAVA